LIVRERQRLRQTERERESERESERERQRERETYTCAEKMMEAQREPKCERGDGTNRGRY
jgi:hypothetical protein